MSPASTAEFDRLSTALAGQYAVERELGRGGMGVVLLARDLRLDRLVALKTLPQHLADDALIRERFLREARTAAALSHPRIVPIHHAAEVNGAVFFVMGYVDGGSAAQLLREHGRLPAALTVPLLVDVAEALGYAHARGVVHRDIKAENILIDGASGRAMVTDFGIARLAESAPMTATGTVLGTVHYMSPEQVNGDALDGRSDLYALGVLAFMLLSGRFPFEHEAPSAVLVAHVTRPAPALRSVAADVPEALAAIVDRLLGKDPVARHADASELVRALQDVDLAAPRAAVAVRASAPLAPRSPAPRANLSSADAAEIWERAAQLQQLTGEQTPPLPVARAERAEGAEPLTRGYRMEDVVAAAKEAGIDAKYVERAIAERAPVAPGAPLPVGVVREGAAMAEAPSAWIGSRTRIEYEVVVEGELRSDDFEEVVDVMRRTFGEFGNASTVGRSVTFISTQISNTTTKVRQLQVSVGVRAGRTTVRVFEDLRPAAHGVIGGVTGGVGGGFGGAMAGMLMGVTASPVIAVATMLGITGIAFTSARFGVKRWTGRKARDLHAATERIAARVRELIEEDAGERAASRGRLKP